MIQIIKHGCLRYRMTCDSCKCIFTFEKADIQNEFRPWDHGEYVNCPECGQKNIIMTKEFYDEDN